MAFDGLRFPSKLKKLMIRTIRSITIPISNHPFVVGGFLFMIFLYRSSPFLFSLLISAFPVLVCTAILLGALLAYGHPQIPDLDKDKNIATVVSSSRAILLQNNVSVEEAMVFLNGRHLSLSSNGNGRQASVATSNAKQKEILQFEDSNSILISDDGEEEDDDSGSDGAESSSPEASMADIIPLLDEIDPLIECENSGLLRTVSHNSSNESGVNSDEETDHKEDAEESAITWTEDDQKNFMDIGTSELERNQRLESLIARRRARRSMNERNLIDLDGFDLTISTTRQNPFDSPNFSYDDIGLPPVPGSAPSILLPRRNPFDLPYDSTEEKPDLTGDSFQQEFMQVSQKEPVFSRHESFQRATRFRPYFVADSSFMRQSSEISELASSYHRQSSDVSESKASSAADQALDDQYVNTDFSHDEIDPIVPDSEMDLESDHVEHGSPPSQNLDAESDVHMPEIRLGGSENLVSSDFKQDERGHIDSWLIDGRNLAESEENKTGAFSVEEEETNVVLETIEEECVSSSSLSVASEEEVMANLDQNKAEVDESFDLSSSVHDMDAEDGHSEVPVYDSSPRAMAESDVEQEHGEKIAPDELNSANGEAAEVITQEDSFGIAEQIEETKDSVIETPAYDPALEEESRSSSADERLASPGAMNE